MLGAAGARPGLHVAAGVQHEPARVLAGLHVPQDAARRQPRPARHTGHRQQRESTILACLIVVFIAQRYAHVVAAICIVRDFVDKFSNNAFSFLK